jgi:hypothetical protein
VSKSVHIKFDLGNILGDFWRPLGDFVTKHRHKPEAGFQGVQMAINLSTNVTMVLNLHAKLSIPLSK